jgi:hypothetical protein
LHCHWFISARTGSWHGGRGQTHRIDWEDLLEDPILKAERLEAERLEHEAERLEVERQAAYEALEAKTREVCGAIEGKRSVDEIRAAYKALDAKIRAVYETLEAERRAKRRAAVAILRAAETKIRAGDPLELDLEREAEVYGARPIGKYWSWTPGTCPINILKSA